MGCDPRGGEYPLLFNARGRSTPPHPPRLRPIWELDDYNDDNEADRKEERVYAQNPRIWFTIYHRMVYYRSTGALNLRPFRPDIKVVWLQYLTHI
jgi:hypothetical protein